MRTVPNRDYQRDRNDLKEPDRNELKSTITNEKLWRGSAAHLSR